MEANIKMEPRTRTIRVDYLARVEGEGKLFLKIREQQVTEAKLMIFEPPRFFEAFLRGRTFAEAPDITARICGICPVAYQMSACHAMENALGVKVNGALRELRRLLYCGEWIESHALHVFMLHAPDFLGYPDAITLAKDHPDVVKQALKLKKIGNEIGIILGGREIHPINVRVGGFYRVPSKRELAVLVDPLKWARDAALAAVKLTSTLPFPEFEYDYEYVSLRHPEIEEYPFNEGNVVSNKGLNIPLSAYEAHFAEEHVHYSTTLHSNQIGKGLYAVGPMARYANNFDRLTPTAQQAARDVGLGPVVNNPFKSIVVRAIETVYACEEALRVIESYEPPARPFVEIHPRTGTGYGATEAPRGMLYHRYKLDAQGNILEAKIVPPTAQNQDIIESDLKHFAERYIDLPDDELTLRCEQAIRNYDPCISCSTHFLKLEVERD